MTPKGKPLKSVPLNIREVERILVFCMGWEYEDVAAFWRKVRCIERERRTADNA